MTIIGLDPHPNGHTAVALDRSGKIAGSLTVPNEAAGCRHLLSWSQGLGERCWAVEGAGNRFVAGLVRQLQAAGERIYNIHPGLTSQYRSRRGTKKNDIVDAENAARVLLANPELAAFVSNPVHLELQALSRNRARLRRQLKASRMALRDLAGSLSVVREALEAATMALHKAVGALDRQAKALVLQSRPDLLNMDGIGPVLAACILAETGDIRRFNNAHHYASYAGAAPVERASGRVKRWCVNPRGNRRLNHALHMAVLTRLRLDQKGSRDFFEKKLREGKTKREAIRCLKTYLAREVYYVLRGGLTY